MAKSPALEIQKNLATILDADGFAGDYRIIRTDNEGVQKKGGAYLGIYMTNPTRKIDDMRVELFHLRLAAALVDNPGKLNPIVLDIDKIGRNEDARQFLAQRAAEVGKGKTI